MLFKDNFNEMLLISECPVIFYCEEPYLLNLVDIQMKIPKLKDTILNPHIQFAVAFLNLSVNELKKYINSFVSFNTKWEFIGWLRTQRESGNLFLLNIEYYLQYCFGQQFDNNNWSLQGISIDEQLFDRISEITLVSCGLLGIQEQKQFNQDKPQWLIEKENEIKRIKSQANKKSGNSFSEFEKVFIPLNYELGYSIEQLMDMNYYHLQFLSKYIPKIVRYDIQKRQVFGGKKIKYITDK